MPLEKTGLVTQSPLTALGGGLSNLFISGLSLDLVGDQVAQEMCVL